MLLVLRYVMPIRLSMADSLEVPPGVREAGCKVVIGTRLKRAGMHWTVYGANVPLDAHQREVVAVESHRDLLSNGHECEETLLQQV